MFSHLLVHKMHFYVIFTTANARGSGHTVVWCGVMRSMAARD